MAYTGPHYRSNNVRGDRSWITMGILYGFFLALLVACWLATETNVGRGVLLGVPIALWATAIAVGVVLQLRRSA